MLECKILRARGKPVAIIVFVLLTDLLPLAQSSTNSPTADKWIRLLYNVTMPQYSNGNTRRYHTGYNEAIREGRSATV